MVEMPVPFWPRNFVVDPSVENNTIRMYTHWDETENKGLIVIDNLGEPVMMPDEVKLWIKATKARRAKRKKRG